MALPSFWRETVCVSRPSRVEARGSFEQGPPSRHEVAGCMVEPAASTTDRGEARELASATMATLYAPPDADVRAGDVVECRAGSFVVEGRPLIRESPTGALAHIECALAEWRG